MQVDIWEVELSFDPMAGDTPKGTLDWPDIEVQIFPATQFLNVHF